MTFQVSITRFLDHMQLVVKGPASIKGFVELVQGIEEESRAWADRRVLVDLRGVEGRLDDAEQVFLGEMVAQHLRHLQKVASVVETDKITRNSETAAQMLGMQLCVFTSPEEARAWLKADGPFASRSSSTPAPTPAATSGSPSDLA